MDTHARFGRRPALGLAALISLISSIPQAEAALVAHYDFEDAAGNFSNLAELLAPELSASAWADADNTLGSAAGNPGFALNARNFHDGNQFFVNLSPAAGFELSLTGISFDHRISATGPTDWELRLNGTPIASGITSTTFKSENITFESIASGDPLVLALYGSGAGGSTGTMRLDNVSISGTLSAASPVPLPAAVWLFAPALFGLIRSARGATEQISEARNSTALNAA
jgi:hypothetical protein